MVLEQIAISELQVEQSIHDLDYEEYECEKAIETYLHQSLSEEDFESWKAGDERSLLTERPLSGGEFLLRQQQKDQPI